MPSGIGATTNTTTTTTTTCWRSWCLSCHGVVVEGVGAFRDGGVDAEVGVAVGEGAGGAEPEYC